MVVGEASGVVQCFSVKKGEVVLSFKTLTTNQKARAQHVDGSQAGCSMRPAHGSMVTLPAHCAALGGLTAMQVTGVCVGRGLKQRDKVFVAAGDTVRCLKC